GSVFTVYLTFGISNQSNEEALRTTGKEMSFEGTVWVVDDDALILELCSIIFKNKGISYRSFNSPTALLNAGLDNTVKYVLMDIRMPGMSGTELCRALREKISDQVRIFAITAQVLPDERDFLLKSGFDGMLMKPFREDELLALLQGEIAISTSRDDEELDLSSLKKMTYGDEEALIQVLLRFKNDCLNDIGHIKSAMVESDLDQLRLITHRLAGRIGQIGAKDLAREYRSCELELRAVSVLGEREKQTLAQLADRLNRLIIQIDRESESPDYSIS
ncbi:MAG: hybrid sensor histidine kinase/response regulator, partial [Sphingobacteriales bacterium]